MAASGRSARDRERPGPGATCCEVKAMVESSAQRNPSVDLEEFERRLRGPAAAPRQDADPLAELARLVNGETGRDPYAGRNDPFAAMPAQQQHSAAVVRLPTAAWDRFEKAAPAPAEAPEPPHHAAPPSMQETFEREMAALHAAGAPDAPAGDRGHEEPVVEETAPWSGDAPPAPIAAKKSNRPFVVMGAISVIAMLGIGTTFAMRSNSVAGGKAPPVIKAAETPVKVAPDAPGGAVVPNQNASILDKGPGAKGAGDLAAGTRVVASAEQPVDLGQVAAKLPGAAAPTRVVTTAVAPPPAGVGPATGSAADAQAAAPQAQGGLFGEPKKVRTVAIRPNGELVAQPADPAAAPPPAAPAAARAFPQIAGLPVTAPSAAPATPAVPVPKPAAPKATVRVVPVPKPAPKPPAAAEAAADPAPAAEGAPLQLPSAGRVGAGRAKLARAAPAPAPEANDQTASTPSGGTFAVQFAAPPSEAEARDRMSRLQKKYGDALDGHTPSMTQATSNGKSVYRIRVNQLSREQAKALCDKMLAAGGKCYVAQN